MIQTKEMEFTTEQKEYLKGFFSGIQESGIVRKSVDSDTSQNVIEANVYGTAIEDLCKEEKFKYEKNGLDCWQDMVAHAKEKKLPLGADIFRFKFHGLFFVGPAQDSFMLRCRIPGGALKAHQLQGLAEMSLKYASGNLDLTTRNNIQIREIPPENIVNILVTLYDLGLTSKGSGADNVRNITTSPTSGFDPQEIIDTMPLAKEMHHHILGNRDLYGMPRKFNIAYDGGGSISACADTNDIAFYAVEIPKENGFGNDVRFRVLLGGITGHKQFASDTGIMIKKNECTLVADAMLRVFLKNGNRTNRKKARLKYLIDEWGLEKFLSETENEFGGPLVRFPIEKCLNRPHYKKSSHIGVHPQKNPTLSYIGITAEVGRLTADQCKEIADLSLKFGAGEVRLTVWQNLLIPHIPNDQMPSVQKIVLNMGLDYRMTSPNAGLVACTGNTGCKFAAANTKYHAKKIGIHLKKNTQMDSPINIHVTGCHHSCAQHYCGDLGLIATKVQVKGQNIEGYNVFIGGGVDDEQGLGRELYTNIPAEDAPALVTKAYKIYQDNRIQGETFVEFSRRNETAQIRSYIEASSNIPA